MQHKSTIEVTTTTLPLALIGSFLVAHPAGAYENGDRPTLLSENLPPAAVISQETENSTANQPNLSGTSPLKLMAPPPSTLVEPETVEKLSVSPVKPIQSPVAIAVEQIGDNPPPIPIPISAPSPNNQNVNLNQGAIDNRNYPQATQAISIPITPSSLNPDANASRSDAPQAIGVLGTSPNKIHVVVPGETLNSIARNYGVSKTEILQANQITNPDLIKVNQSLTIPTGSSFSQQKPTLIASRIPIKSDRTVKTISSNPSQGNKSYGSLNSELDPYNGTPPENPNRSQMVSSIPIEIEYYNPMLQPSPGTMVSPELPPLNSPEQYLPDSDRPFTGYIWPAKGVLTSGYGWRWGRMHKGIDIAAPVGTPIMAAADGEVISAGWNSGGYGNLVKLRHFDGSITLYAHNSRILVRRGQQVEQGQQIAAMGSTGYSTGPHLHFEIHPNGRKAVNPIAFLPQK